MTRNAPKEWANTYLKGYGDGREEVLKQVEVIIDTHIDAEVGYCIDSCIQDIKKKIQALKEKKA